MGVQRELRAHLYLTLAAQGASRSVPPLRPARRCHWGLPQSRELALLPHLGRDARPAAFASRRRRGAEARRTENGGRQSTHPLFLCSVQADESERHADAQPTVAVAGKMGDIQGVQPARCRSRTSHPAEAQPVPRASISLGRIRARPANQRPRHPNRPHARHAGDGSRRACAGGIDGTHENHHAPRKSQLRRTDERLARRAGRTDGKPQQERRRTGNPDRERARQDRPRPAAASGEVLRQEISGDADGGLC